MRREFEGVLCTFKVSEKTVTEAHSSRAAKKGQGTMSLAGCRDSVPAGVWGNAPTVFRALNSKGTVNKGAGSEASLPVTLRVLRRAPKLLFQPIMLCRAKWARPDCRSFKHSCFLAGDFPSKRESADFPRLVRLELLRRVKRVIHQRHQSQRNRNPEDDSVQRQ